MSTITSLPAPTWLRALTTARATYEETLGWPVSIHVTRRDLMLIVDGTLTAIDMPARLGARIRQELDISLLPAPIIADGTHWTFLTRPVAPLRPDVAHDLAAVHVRVAPRTAAIDLPLTPTSTTPTTRRWVEPPTPSRPLPPGSVVVALVRRLTYDGGHLAA